MFGRPKNEVDAYAKNDILVLNQNNLKSQKSSSNISKEKNSKRKKNTQRKTHNFKEDKIIKSNFINEEENISQENQNIQVDNEFEEENQNTQFQENPFDLDDSQIINQDPILANKKHSRKKNKSHKNNYIESVDKIKNKINEQSFDPEKPINQLPVPFKEIIFRRKVLDQSKIILYSILI